MSEQEKGKVLVVLGTVLGSGEVSDAVNVYAKRFTKSAKDKIEAKKGTAKSLLELSSGKSNVKEWVMVK
jgi:ribosomal protein L18E